jgi:hypothetical protein
MVEVVVVWCNTLQYVTIQIFWSLLSKKFKYRNFSNLHFAQKFPNYDRSHFIIYEWNSICAT